MVKVLVIQGAGMNMRGKAQVETFGPMTLEEIQDMLWEQEKKKNPRSLIPYSGNPTGTQRMKSVLDA